MLQFIHQTISDYLQKKRKRTILNKLNSIKLNPNRIHHNDKYVNFSHIGLLGDIIFSMPAMFALAKGKKIRLYLDLQHNTYYSKKHKHYANRTTLNEKSVALIAPLILSNPQFEVCQAWNNEIIDYDLNEFRHYPFDYRMGHIARWYFLAFGINYDLSKPWINVTPNNLYKDCILLSRSFRYRALGIDYGFFNKYQNLKFIGLPDEYEDIKKTITNIDYIKVSNALEMAEIIAGCKLYVGNQSFPFAVAESLKVKRVLELNYDSPTNIVDGVDGYDFCFQQQFEKIIKDILG